MSDNQAFTTEEEYLIHIKIQQQLDRERVYLLQEQAERLASDANCLVSPVAREHARIILIRELAEKLEESAHNEWYRHFKEEQQKRDNMIFDTLEAIREQNPYSAVNLHENEKEKTE